MEKKIIAIRFRSNDPALKDEYWAGYNCERNYEVFAVTTSNIEMAKTFISGKVAVKSAKILNQKCSNNGRFFAIQRVIRQPEKPQNDPDNGKEAANV